MLQKVDDDLFLPMAHRVGAPNRREIHGRYADACGAGRNGKVG
jgi:hypothetical protein